MDLRSQRGTVLVAGMVILALLTLMGAGSLLTATLDTQLTANQSVSREAFYAAEAGLDAGAGALFAFVNANLRAPNPATVPGWSTWVTPTLASSGINGADYMNLGRYRVEYRLSYQGTLTGGGQPRPYPFSTPERGQELNHQAYTYLLEGRATSLTGAGGGEQMSETLQVLETPLVQYYVFFNDDLGWHPGPEMISWGRVHTNGDLGLANQHANGVTFRNHDNDNNETPCSITVSGRIRYRGHLQQNGTWAVRNPTGIFVRVNNLGTIPSAGGAASAGNADYVQINTSIDGTNQAAEEARFRDADNRFHVRVGVDRMPTATVLSLNRSGFYETEALDPMKEDVDGLVILADPWRILFNPFDGPAADVTDLVRDYQVDPGVLANIDTWPAGARTNASHTGAAPSVASSAAPPIPRTMVYSPEDPVLADELGGVATTARGPTANRFYPCVLERQDRRETLEVDLTVIDLQRLQYWYRDYLDYRDGGLLDGSINATLVNRSLLIYVSRSTPGGGFAAGSGIGALQAVKLIGSSAGRTRRADDMQDASPTLLVRTTLATDNPIYLEGDFNSPNHAGGTTVPGGVGCAIISDAMTLLSNNWGPDLYVAPGTPPNTGGFDPPNQPTASDGGTVYNAAFFTGRYNFRAFPTGAEEAGIHNFPRFAETWTNTRTCTINGCLINLWFSQQSEAPHALTAYYSPPLRSFGWDRQFGNPSYWPPYVPSIYSVERTAWRED